MDNFKLLSGSRDGKFSHISINNSRTNTPIKINGDVMGLKHLVENKVIKNTETGAHFVSLELPPVNIKDSDLLIKDSQTNKLHRVVHAGIVQDLVTQASDSDPGTIVVKQGSVLSSGDHLQIQASPAPIVICNKQGTMDSFNLWNATFSPYILGYADADKPDHYSQGLVRAGSATHSDQFLRKDGQWAQPSLTYSGTVSENFLSLNDTPTSYSGAENKYVRVTYSGGGGLEFNSPTTTEITEGSNLYYTDARVATKTSSLLSSGDINSLVVNGNISANSFISTSDKRLKENIQSLGSGECNLLLKSLPLPHTYNLKGNDNIRYGFIAQQVRETHPELVSTKRNGYLGIEYIDLISLLVGRTNYLERQLEVLRNEIAKK